MLDKLDYCGTLKNLAAATTAPGFKFIKGDLQSGDLLSYILSTERIDTVMHFAAQACRANLVLSVLFCLVPVHARAQARLLCCPQAVLRFPMRLQTSEETAGN